MVPAWLTVVISLGGAFIAGAAASVTQLVTARTQRDKELYFRRIDAAARFSASAQDALSVVRDAVKKGAPPVDDAKETEALQVLHKAEARQALVGLLFAKESPAAQGKDALDSLRDTVHEIRKQEHVREARIPETQEVLEDFHEAALEVLKRGRWYGSWRRVRGSAADDTSS
jgi:hypothetical protein